MVEAVEVSMISIQLGEMMKKYCNLRQMGGEELGHSKGTDFVVAKDLGHLLVWGEELLVCGILEVVLFQVSPKLFDAFSTTGLKKKKIRIKYLDLIFFNQLGSF